MSTNTLPSLLAALTALPSYNDIQLALDELSKHADTMSLGADQPDEIKHWQARKRAYDNAGAYVLRLQTRNDPMGIVAGRLLMVSSNGAQGYRTTAVECNCEAGVHGKFCKHMAVAEAVEELFDTQVARAMIADRLKNVGAPK